MKLDCRISLYIPRRETLSSLFFLFLCIVVSTRWVDSPASPSKALSFSSRRRKKTHEPRWLGYSSRVSVEFNLLNESPAGERQRERDRDALWISSESTSMQPTLDFCRNEEGRRTARTIDGENISSYPQRINIWRRRRVIRRNRSEAKMDDRRRRNFPTPLEDGGSSLSLSRPRARRSLSTIAASYCALNRAWKTSDHRATQFPRWPTFERNRSRGRFRSPVTATRTQLNMIYNL